MSTEALELTADPAGGRLARLLWALRDGWTLTRRELGHLRHEPGELVGVVLFPAILVLLFGYVFGSAIPVPGGNYREYLMPGLFAMTAIAGLGGTALLVSRDVALGVMDRFRSMPMARSAMPFGRTAADLLLGVLGIAVMVAIGLLVGWRIHNGLLPALAAFALILLLEYAVSWAAVFLGLVVKPETADRLIPLVFPISMISNSFVPTAGMPDGCARSRTGTRSARSSWPAGSCSATPRGRPRARPGPSPTRTSRRSAGRCCCCACSSRSRRGATARRTGEAGAARIRKHVDPAQGRPYRHRGR